MLPTSFLAAKRILIFDLLSMQVTYKEMVGTCLVYFGHITNEKQHPVAKLCNQSQL